MGSMSAENEAKAKLVADHVRELLEAAGYVGVTVQPMDAGGMVGFMGRWKIPLPPLSVPEPRKWIAPNKGSTWAA
jgi:hypothetical protein